jgi:hypothetical protein
MTFPVELKKTREKTYFFKPQRLKYQLLAFLVHDDIKHFPVLFSRTFSNCFLFFAFFFLVVVVFFLVFFSSTGNVISGQNTRKNGGNRLRMRAPKGTPSGSRVPTFCLTTIVRKKAQGKSAHAPALTSVTSGPDRFR